MTLILKENRTYLSINPRLRGGRVTGGDALGAPAAAARGDRGARALRAQGARAELPDGPQPHRQDRPRGGRSRRLRRARGRAGTRRADPGAARRGGAPCGGDRARRALPAGAGRDRRRRARAADGAPRRRAGGRPGAAPDPAGPRRGEPALQRRHRASGALADPAGLAAVLELADADVPEGGRRAHRGGAGLQGLRAALDPGAMALPRRASSSSCRRAPSPRRPRSRAPWCS